MQQEGLKKLETEHRSFNFIITFTWSNKTETSHIYINAVKLSILILQLMALLLFACSIFIICKHLNYRYM